MSRMIFDLTDDDRALLEAHRARLGLRSHAETLRVLIRREGEDREYAKDYVDLTIPLRAPETLTSGAPVLDKPKAMHMPRAPIGSRLKIKK